MPDAPIETQPLPEAAEPAPVDNPEPADKPLGEAGEKALKAEREARKALEKQVAEMAPLLDLVKGLRGAVPGVEPTDMEKLAAELEEFKAEATKERLARLRIEVATTAEIPLELAARLQGTTAEELAADAEALKALFPTQTTPEVPQGRRGDPAQGARPGGTSGGIQSGAAKYEARKKQPPTY
jgi:predicted RNase H-like nuclease (RuvC/YqgF family)